MSITAQELRIGNWVYDGEKKRNCAIEEIRGESVLLDPSPYAGTKLSWLMPIPLTPDVLKKCGFDKYNDGLAMDAWASGQNARFDLWFTSGRLYIKSRYEAEHSNLDAHYLPHIRYLHQLQNLYFSLTGTELNYTP